MGHAIPERVNGTDLLERLSAVSAAQGYHLLLLGASPQSAAGALRVLRGRHPQLRVSGCQPPYRDWSTEDLEQIDRDIEAHAPDLVAVAFGTPRAETWIHDRGRSVGAQVLVGIGGSLDLLGGSLPRAPLRWQSAGCEWLWRLGHEPKRLASRYLGRDSRFALVLAVEIVRGLRRALNRV